MLLLEAQIRLVHQGSGLQHVTGVRLAQILVDDAAQAVIERRHQGSMNVVVTFAPTCQELADCRRSGCLHTVLLIQFRSARKIPANGCEVNGLAQEVTVLSDGFR